MEQFGWNPAGINLWNDIKQRALAGCARAYRESTDDLDMIAQLKDPQSVISQIIGMKPNGGLVASVVGQEAAIRTQMEEYATLHSTIMANTDSMPPAVPKRAFVVPRILYNLLAPPTLSFEAAVLLPTKKLGKLTSRQCTVVLNNGAADRPDIIRRYFPDAVGDVAIMIDYNTRGAASRRAMMRYDDGDVIYSSPIPLTDGTAGVYAFVPPLENPPVPPVENYISEWIKVHKGAFKATFGYELRDVADRVFIVQLVDLDFEVKDGNVIRDLRQMVV